MDRATRFWSKVDRSGDCWLWLGYVLEDGYGQFGRAGERRAHRVAFELTHGPIPDGAQVLHRCDVPLCMRPVHLYLGDHDANMRDRDERGRTARGSRSSLSWLGRRAAPGEDHHGAKLTAEQVTEIRALYVPNPGRRPAAISQRVLARRYGVSQQQISVIVTEKGWKPLTL